MARTLVGLTAAAAMALAAAGCGDSDSDAKPSPEETARTQITKVVGELQEASVAGDGRRICNDIFTPKLADSVTSAAASGSCATEVEDNLFSPETKLTVEDVELTQPSDAVATIEDQDGTRSKVFFARQSGIWRIRSVQAT